MRHKVDNAIIMAAGTSSRFAPLSYEKPKGLITVRGEVLIERQIRQLIEAGIKEIVVVTGYKAEQFEYLKEKYGVKLVKNEEYLTKNNNASIYVSRKYINNSYICSADNYYLTNPFQDYEYDSFYTALYSKGFTNEWCMEEDEEGFICKVVVGGSDSWYMLGHAFWTSEFSERFIKLLENIYHDSNTKNKLWESIYIDGIDDLKMRIKKYDQPIVFEFDTLDELRTFDDSYVDDTRSSILKGIAGDLRCKEKDIICVTAYRGADNSADGFTFVLNGKEYSYNYASGKTTICE